MSTEYGKRLRAARKHAGLTQQALSAATGIPQSTISTAERVGHGSSETTVYARECGVDAHWLATGDGEMIPSITTSKVKFSLGSQAAQGDLSIPARNTLANDNSANIDDKLIHAGGVGRGRLVPVVGMARLGDNGFYEEISSMSGAGDGMVEAYSNDPHAYALRVRGDSMFPSIRDGWYVIVEPGSAAAPGDYVLIKLKTGQKMVKELIMLRPDGITVVSVNGDARKTIEADEIDPHFGIQSVSAIVSPKKWIPA